MEIQKALGTAWQIRDQILALYYTEPWSGHTGTTRAYRNAPVSVMEHLVTLDFLDPEDKQNEAPTAQEFIDFMTEYPEIKCHGYVTHWDRHDNRITIEGLEGALRDCDKGTLQAFEEFCKDADSLKVPVKNGLFAWWD